MTKHMSDDLTVPVTPSESLAVLALADLRDFRNRWIEEEEKVSYWRRLVQGRLNLIKSEKEDGVVPIANLIRSLGSTASPQRRQQLLNVDAQDELPQLPGLDDLWTSAINLADEEGTRLLIDELRRVERELSDYRRLLHERIDAATAELISRYKADPMLSLELFPHRAN